MKTILASFLAILLIVSMVSVIAEEVETTDETGDEVNIIIAPNSDETETGIEEIPEEETGGIGPDRPLLWGLERAIERIRLQLTLNKAEKARLGLAHARERLLEVREMIKLKKLTAAEKAKEEHGRALGRVKARLREIEAIDPEEELEEELEIEEEIAEHEEDIENVETEIEVKIKGELTDEQQEDVDNLIAAFKDKAGELEIEIEVEADKTKTKIKAKTELSDEEIEDIIEEKRAKYAEARERRAERRVARFEKVIGKAEARIATLEEKDIDVSGLEEKLNLAKDLLAQAEELKTAEDYKGLRETLREATQLSKEARRGKPFDETGRARAAAVITKVIARRQAIAATRDKVDSTIEKLTAVSEKLGNIEAWKTEKISSLRESIAKTGKATTAK